MMMIAMPKDFFSKLRTRCVGPDALSTLVSLAINTPRPPREAGGFLMSPPCLESQGCQFDPTFLYLLSCSSA